MSHIPPAVIHYYESAEIKMELLKIVTIFILLLFMMWKRVQLGHILFVCAILFGVLQGVDLKGFGIIAIETVVSVSSITIFMSLFLINIMESIMRSSGAQSRLVQGIKGLLGNPKLAMGLLPAIIGFLPSLGGAKFSAPLVDEAAKEVVADAEHKASINYYYRHVWEYYLPLYPANLLAIEILGIHMSEFIMVMLPYTFFHIMAGLSLFIRIKRITDKKEFYPNLDVSPYTKWVAEGLSPIIVILLIVILFQVPMLLALSIIVVIMFMIYKINTGEISNIVIRAMSPRLFYMIFASIFLRNVLVASGSVIKFSGFLQSAGVSAVVITLVLPLAIGLITGVPTPGITIGLPLILAMISPGDVYRFGSLAVFANEAGTLLSPLHMCLIMSVEHFSADFAKTYIRLLLPVFLLICLALIYSSTI